MRICEVLEQPYQLEEGLASWLDNKIEELFDRVFGTIKPLKPGDFDKLVGKIRPNETEQEVRANVERYLEKARLEREAEELAQKNKTTVEKVKEFLINAAAVVLSRIDVEKLGEAIGKVIFWILKRLVEAMLKR